MTVQTIRGVWFHAGRLEAEGRQDKAQLNTPTCWLGVCLTDGLGLGGAGWADIGGGSSLLWMHLVVACVKSQIHQFSSHSPCGSSGLEIVPFLRLRAGELWIVLEKLVETYCLLNSLCIFGS